MAQFQPYDFAFTDSDGNLLSESGFEETSFTSSQHLWFSVDAGLESMRHGCQYDNLPLNYPRHMQNTQHFHTTYNPLDHGFSPTQPSPSSIHPFQPNWYHNLDHNRHVRLISPATSATGSLGSNSSQQDYAFSPEVTSEFSVTSSFTPYEIAVSPPTVFSNRGFCSQQHLPASCPTARILPSQIAYSLKDFQYGPDIGADLLSDGDAVFDGKNTVEITISDQSQIQPPEELDLIEHRSPADSGLGQSVIDDIFLKEKSDDDTGEDDDDADVNFQDNDVDSDFLPTKSVRRPTRLSVSRSLRSSQSLQRTTSNSTNSSILKDTSRVHKRAVSRNSAAKAQSKLKNKNYTPHSRGSVGTQPRYFPCTFHHYGCPSIFASKNEWKRHVASQHLQLGYYRCDMGSCIVNTDNNRGHNDFNRKDLFTQHCRRMHAPWGNKDINTVPKREREAYEKEMENIRERCWFVRRRAPTWAVCGLCDLKFEDQGEEGSKTWEDRMEHVGRHYEKDNVKEGAEKDDEGLKQWAIREGVVEEGKDGTWWLIGYEPTQNTNPRNSRRRASTRSRNQVSSKDDIDDVSEDDDNEPDITTAASEDSSPDIIGEPDIDDDMEMDSDTDAEGEDE